MQDLVIAEARLRAKSQLTLPEAVVAAAGVEPGDRFVVEASVAEPGVIRLYRVRATYAGSMRGVYGPDPTAHLAAERATWRRDADGE